MKKQKKLISKEDFISYFRCHSNVNTAKHFDITTTTVLKLCALYEFKKSKEDIALTKETTCLERYGVKNPYQADFVKGKCKNLMKKNEKLLKNVKKHFKQKQNHKV